LAWDQYDTIKDTLGVTIFGLLHLQKGEGLKTIADPENKILNKRFDDVSKTVVGVRLRIGFPNGPMASKSKSASTSKLKIFASSHNAFAPASLRLKSYGSACVKREKSLSLSSYCHETLI
jgi:hypothetical protein